MLSLSKNPAARLVYETICCLLNRPSGRVFHQILLMKDSFFQVVFQVFFFHYHGGKDKKLACTTAKRDFFASRLAPNMIFLLHFWLTMVQKNQVRG